MDKEKDDKTRSILDTLGANLIPSGRRFLKTNFDPIMSSFDGFKKRNFKLNGLMAKLSKFKRTFDPIGYNSDFSRFTKRSGVSLLLLSCIGQSTLFLLKLQIHVRKKLYHATIFPSLSFFVDWFNFFSIYFFRIILPPVFGTVGSLDGEFSSKTSTNGHRSAHSRKPY